MFDIIILILMYEIKHNTLVKIITFKEVTVFRERTNMAM